MGTLVQVRLQDDSGRPIDGTVTLRGSTTYRVTTTASRGTFASVAAGTYTASVEPVRGSPVSRNNYTVSGNGTSTLAFTIPQTTDSEYEVLPILQYLQPALRSCKCNSGLSGVYDDKPWIAGIVGAALALLATRFLFRKG